MYTCAVHTVVGEAGKGRIGLGDWTCLSLLIKACAHGIEYGLRHTSFKSPMGTDDLAAEGVRCHALSTLSIH